jgi:DNA-binding MarR family transcriptional regulator
MPKPRAKQPHRTSLPDALFTATQQKVLGLLFGQPDRSFYASEIIEIAGIGSGAVQRELKRLEESGLVNTQQIGNRKHYQANRATPIFEELRLITIKTFGVADAIREALQPLTRKIDWAIMYGSVAKGSDVSSSDIDVLIVGNRITLEELFKQLDPIETRLRRKINPTVLTKAEYTRRAGQHGFVSRVLQGNYIPLIGDKDAATAAG